MCEIVAKKLSLQLPMQYQEYKASNSLVYDDIDTEVREVIENLKRQQKANQIVEFFPNRQEVFDNPL